LLNTKGFKICTRNERLYKSSNTGFGHENRPEKHAGLPTNNSENVGLFLDSALHKKKVLFFPDLNAKPDSN